MMRRFFKLLFLALLVLCFSASQERVGGKLIKKGMWKSKPIEYVDGEILVGFKKWTKKEDARQLLNQRGATILEHYEQKDWAVTEVADSQDIFEVISELEKHPLVKYAEPNIVGRLLSDPYDTDFGKQWYFKNTGQNPPAGTTDADIDAPEAWNITQGSSDIIIAVLDTGIPTVNNALSHPELNDISKIIIGRSFTQDGDSVRDMKGHGTHVTGIIAAKANNNYGVAGLANGCKILVVKISPNNGATTAAWMRAGMDYAAENGARVVNISQGLPASSTVENGIDHNDQVLFVAGAGNNIGSVKYPAAYSSSYSNMIAVSATDHNDEFATLYSNYGPEINVSAPGGHGKTLDPFDNRYPPGPDDIYSTFPNYSYGGTTNFGYNWGTSMSTPIVSAIAGLMLSKNPNLTPLQIRSTIEHTVEDKGATGRDDYYGYGRVNAYYALLAVVGPQNFRTTNPNNSNVSLAWDPIPASALQHYELERNINGWGWTLIATTTSTSFSDNQFQRNNIGNDVVQYRIRSKTVDNLYSLYSNILNVSGTSYWQQDKKLTIQQLPSEFVLSQNHPNPFNPSTTINYQLPENSYVNIKIFDMIGREVATLVDEYKTVGYHTVQVDGSELSSGVYFYKMVAGKFVSARKFSLTK